MKPIYTMILKDKVAFKKLKEQIVFWNGIDGINKLTEDRIFTINSNVLTYVLGTRMDSAMISYRHPTSDTIYTPGKRLMETVLDIQDANVVDLIIHDYNKMALKGLNGVFKVEDNVITASVEKPTGIIHLCVYNENRREVFITEPEIAPVVEIDTDNDIWFTKLQVLAEIAGIPIKRKEKVG